MILNKNSLVENILNDLSDNATGQISPYDVRHNLLDIIDSVHLLTVGHNLTGSNFSTQDTRTTKIGIFSIEKIDLEGYSSVDNTALGYSSLKSNYQGSKNTALGSYALSCNLFGEDNVAVGFHALAGNTNGFNNIGLGNFALNNNKVGTGNIAIGHGAGYYVTRDTSNQLFIASHDVDSDFICDNPLGVGLNPLIRGDLLSLRLAIATNNINPYGTLQIAGHTTPSLNNAYDLGHPSYKFKHLYLSSGIKLGNYSSFEASNSGVFISGNVLPLLSQTYNLGSESYKWLNGYFDNIYVSGEASINTYKSIQNCEYVNKTLYLASSGSIDGIDGGGPYGLLQYYTLEDQVGHPCGYLSDEQLIDAGLIIKSSGDGYQRDYTFTFSPPDPLQLCQFIDSTYSQASWNSNISLHLSSGTGAHLKTNRIIAHDNIGIVTPSSCYGINIHNTDERVYVSRSDIINDNLAKPNGDLVGVGNVNFFSNSGDISSNYFLTVGAIESGITVGQRFLTGIKKRTKDIDNKDQLSGFEIKYIDDSNLTVLGSLTDRLVIGSYHDTSYVKNALVLMKDNVDGILGINNLSPTADDTLPKTTVNIRSTGNAVVRVTAENQGNIVSSLQLLGANNCLVDGCELEYVNASGFADLSIYKDSGKVSFIRSYEDNTIGIFTGSGTSNSMVTFGDSVYTDAVLSLHVSSGNPESTKDYGKLFIRPKIQPYQANTIYLLDGSGNVHDLVVNKYNVDDGRGLYTDIRGNTLGGRQCPISRTNLVVNNNTSIGFKSLYGITGGNNNTIFGATTASGLTTGSNNIIIGYNTAPSLESQDYNIVIGNDNIGNFINDDYNFVLGSKENRILLKGKTGPNNSDKVLEMPSGGSFIINNSTNSEATLFRANFIDTIDRGGSVYPDNTLTFKFSGSSSSNLLALNHSANPMTNVVDYEIPDPLRPYAELNGDLKLKGAIRFSDGTSLDSAEFLDDITKLLEISIVEGYVPSQIQAPESITSPTSGIFIIKDKDWVDVKSVFLSNRDTSSFIQAGAYVVATRVNGQYRPIWVSSDTCDCCPRS
jgi:hypothetical protein